MENKDKLKEVDIIILMIQWETLILVIFYYMKNYIKLHFSECKTIAC